MSSAIENGMKGMLREYGIGITNELGKLYGFNVEEALKHIEQIQITIDKKRKTPAKTQDGEAVAPKKKTVKKAKPDAPVPTPVEGEVVVTEGEVSTSETETAPKKKTVKKAKPAAQVTVPVEGEVVSEAAPKKRQPKKAKPVTSPIEGEVTTEPVVAPKKRQPKKATVEGEAPKKQTKKDKPITIDVINLPENVMKASPIESCPFPNMEIETDDEEEEEEILKKHFYIEEKGERIRKSFYVTSEINGLIFASKQSTTNAYDSDDDIGEEVGKIVDGKPVFFEQMASAAP
jgi:hypothetical protein